MNKLLLTTAAALALFAAPALATGAFETGGIGTYAHHNPVTRVQQWEERLEYLLEQQAAGKEYYGSGHVPIEVKIKQTQKQLDMYRAAEAAGNPYPPTSGDGSGKPKTDTGVKVDTGAPPVDTGAAGDGAGAVETPAAASVETAPAGDTPAETQDTGAASSEPKSEAPEGNGETPDGAASE